MKTPQEITPLEVPLVIGDGRRIFQGPSDNRYLRRIPNQPGITSCPLCGGRRRQTLSQALTTATLPMQMGGEVLICLVSAKLSLPEVAVEIRKSRGDLIGAAAANTGKIFTEADVEVSESIDFAEFYPHATRHYAQMANLCISGRGVGCGDRTLELPHRHSLRRHHRRFGRRQHRHLQAIIGCGPHRLDAVPMFLASRCFAKDTAIHALLGKRRRPLADR